jgi:hypothetical protein
MSSKANKEYLSRGGKGEEVPQQFDHAITFGIIYEYINNIRYDPTHLLYPELSSHDGKYIGATIQKSVEDRYAGDPFKNHHNKHLLEAIEKFGKENFSIEIIARPPLEDLWREEARWVEINDCVYPNGYNINVPSSSREYKASSYTVKRWVRNIKTDKVFEISSMKEFCHNPSKFDANYESSKKFLTVDLKSKPIINLQQLSNAFTGYITPSDRSSGIKQADKIVCSGLYAPARYTLKDIEKLKDYRHKLKVLDLAKSIKYPLTLIDSFSLEEKVIANDRDVLELLAPTTGVAPSSLRNFLEAPGHQGQVAVLRGGTKSYLPKELFFEGTYWWRHNTDGSPSVICVIVKKTNKPMSFSWTTLAEFSQKLRHTGKVQYMPKNKAIEHSTFGKSLRMLVKGKAKTAYGLMVDDKKCDLRVRLLRFFSSPEVSYCKKAGHDVSFNMEGLSETERHTCEKILKLRSDIYQD